VGCLLPGTGYYRGMAKLNYVVLGLLLILGQSPALRAEETPVKSENASSDAPKTRTAEKNNKEGTAVKDPPAKTSDGDHVEPGEAPPKGEAPQESTTSNPESGGEAPQEVEDAGASLETEGAGAEQPMEAPESNDADGDATEVAATPEASAIDESQFEDMKTPEVEPFAKGDMEAALNLAMAGSGDYFYFGAGASYSYYVIDRLAPGIEINYTHVFLNQDFGYSEPNTITMLPFLKFVVMRSRSVAPYLIAAGGYQAEWGSDVATNAWIAGGGGGVHVGLGKHFALNIQLLALYYWYGNTRVYSYRDGGIVNYDGNDYVCSDSGKCDRDFEGEGSFYAAKTEDPNGMMLTDSNTGKTAGFIDCAPVNGVTPPECLQTSAYRCDVEGKHCAAPYNDPKDKRRELFFPLITFGITYFF